jgi:hypothetical protein
MMAMKKVDIALIVLFLLLFTFNEVSLTKFLPEALHDDNVYRQWFKYFIVKDAITDAMFFLLAVIVFRNTTGALKAFCLFAVFLTGGSFIDKVVFNLNQYLVSDIALIVTAGIVSIYLYHNRWKNLKNGL